MSRRIIYFYMTGCPHCNATWPAWKIAKQSLTKDGTIVEEKESKDVGPADGVSSFPTFVIYKNGREVKRVQGSEENPKTLLSKLGRRSSRGRRTRRRNRKFRGRTLRNNVAFA